MLLFSRSVLSDSLPPRDCSMPGFPVLYYVTESTQAHVHWVGDAIQTSHPLLSSSSPTFNLSQHQGLFQWVTSFHQVAKVLELQLQHLFLQWIFRVDFLSIWGTLKSLLQHHSSKASILGACLLYGPILTSVHEYWKNHRFNYTELCRQSDVSL